MPGVDEIEFDVSSEPASVAVDGQDLEEMLGNLLENAMKWRRGAVLLSQWTDGNIVRFAVEDDGPGIDPDKREAALREGMRLDTAMPGTGLGLAIVNDLVKAYGGDFILSESKSLGGLCCTISLPSVGATAARRKRA
jgi:signal transduction histidine kinase